MIIFIISPFEVYDNIHSEADWKQRIMIMRGSGGGGTGGPDPLPLEYHKNTGFLRNTGTDRMKNHEATKPAFNVGSSLERQRNAISMAYRWRADDDPLIVVFGSSFPSST